MIDICRFDTVLGRECFALSVLSVDANVQWVGRVRVSIVHQELKVPFPWALAAIHNREFIHNS